MIRRLMLPSYAAAVAAAMLAPGSAWALDSYRYLHVTIETPWFIFLFLLPIVLSPLVLMVVLYWRFSFRRQDEGQNAGTSEPTETK